MAYAATITVSITPRAVLADYLHPSSPFATVYVLTITETEAAQTSETEIVLADEGLPPVGQIHAQLCQLTAGTGTTIDPVLGDTTDPASDALWKLENETAAAQAHNQPTSPVKYGPEVTSFFHRAAPNNAAADHSITTRYYITAGWE